MTALTVVLLHFEENILQGCNGYGSILLLNSKLHQF